MVVFFNRVNSKFVTTNKTNQKTGLDVCIDMICKATGAKHIHIDDHEQVFEFLNKNKVRVVIFEALNFSYKSINQLKQMFGIECYVHLHSAYPFMSMEPMAAHYIENCKKSGIGIIFNSKKMLDMFPYEKNLCLENIYSFDSVDPKIFSGDVLNVGCHGSLRHMKNVPAQAISAIRFCDDNNLKLRFHVNSRSEGEGEAISSILKYLFKETNHELVFCKWMSHNSFKSYCETLDLGLQLSMSETFNIVAADYVSSGVPIVVSDQIEWADKLSVAKYDSVSEIKSKIELSLNNPVLVKRNQDLLSRKSSESIFSWRNFLGV